MKGQAQIVWIVVFFIIGSIFFGLWTQGPPTEIIETFNEFLGFTSDISQTGTKCEVGTYKGKTLKDFQNGLDKLSGSPAQYPKQVLELYRGMNICFKGAMSAKLPGKEVTPKQVLIASAQGYLGDTEISTKIASVYIELYDVFHNELTKEEIKFDFSSKYDDAKNALKCDKTLDEVQLLILDDNPLSLALSRVLFEESIASCSVIMGGEMATLSTRLIDTRNALNDEDKTTYYEHLCLLATQEEYGAVAKSLIKGSEQQGARLACEDWEWIT